VRFLKFSEKKETGNGTTLKIHSLYIYNAIPAGKNRQILERFEKYTAEDFVRDHSFRAWILSGQQQNNAFWSDYLKQHPEKEGTLVKARAMLNALHQMQEIPDTTQKGLTWKLIHEEINKTEETGTLHRRIGWNWLAAASVILALLAMGRYVMQTRKYADLAASEYRTGEERIDLTERYNQSDKPERIALSDGSTVLLQPGSRLSFEARFSGSTRKVYLTGDAFFDVAKDKQKPFIVHANKLVVQVVGTSFNVSSAANALYGRVAVKTGIVNVFTLSNYLKQEDKGTADMVTLTPNQQVTYDARSNSFEKGLVAEPVMVSKPEDNPDFYFRNTSVRAIFEALETSYGVKIRCSKESVTACNLTAPLGNEPLFRKLDIICQTIGATYEVWGTEIVVSGEGCKHESTNHLKENI
jgi:ferric-dicitrate binding protein FerR (iron transport regulator)